MQLTQQPTVFNSANKGKYVCFWASEPHNAILDSEENFLQSQSYW